MNHINHGSLAPELFIIHDPLNKVSVNVRDATDDQLEKARASAQQAQADFLNQIQNILAQHQQACMAHAVFTYEIDRRSRTIQIARVIQ